MAEQDPVKYFKSEIKRLNYYNSQFLVDTDFNDEQLYHKQMRRFHNRALHTWGIVEGLEVLRVDNASKVTVAPGAAIDRLGQEIVLAKQSDPIGFDNFDAGAQVYVTIRYVDVADPADKDTSDTQMESERYKRWTERPLVDVSAAEPAPDAAEMVLAVVTLGNNKSINDVSPSRRRYAGSRIGSSDKGKEFGIHADAAGAWHFFDGGKGAKGGDRLTIADNGNVGIGAPPTAARLSLLTTPGPYDGTLVDLRVGEQYKLSIRSIAPERDTVAYHFDLVNNLGRFDSFLVLDRGKVGIGTPTPEARLDVAGSVRSTSGGYVFPDGTTQLTAAGSARIPAENVAAGSFGANTGGGNYTFPASVYWGLKGSRTEAKDDAGLKGSKSGFFEALTPVNYYAGASGWQHLIEARHQNDDLNDALQIAGSFGDQNLYMRKTANDSATKWSQFVLMNPDGNVAIGNVAPGTSKLKIAKSATDFAHVRFSGNDVGMGEFEIVGWVNGWNINTKSDGKHLYINRDAKDTSDVLIGHDGRELTVKGKTGFVGIGGAPAPATKLAVGGNGADAYGVDLWVERNIYVSGNETLTQGGRGRLRVGTAGAYIGLYADSSSTGAANDLVLGASSHNIRIGEKGKQNLLVSGSISCAGSISCGGYVGLKTTHKRYVSARGADESWNVRQADVFQSYESFTLEMACSREFKENISGLTAAEATATLRDLNPVKYDYKGERAFRQNLGFIAEEMPDNLASADRRTISPFEVVPVLTRVVKEQQESIARLEEAVRALQEEAGRGGRSRR